MLRPCVINFKSNWVITSLSSSSLTITVTTLASKWLLMKLFMGDGVDLLLDVLKLVKLDL